uniref:GINS subunit domain-containing protein n=1 Tax=Eucampia antarctica TaxID=49252 RepID=A0A7S2VZ32_9STRA|mmetsp:Transcript_12800/g.12418  ORF Transcript_12800/g.12418 Transcript_12800/m.12418 type:complete len:209 (+) Transcript_12800:52-678(+)|eukprot:CAMPEP_0197837712 /NCGR_PEP_ID=MMETSP1437-20131217/33029_1 /TAXON_ID=49252 ORGANISM="Eucampia antarctica, Strain CCMP1452" /NCGR_SAMPLE_ID=MMETSP1437 /ASSEMBLY_ACC=CAM_ASM_001096 /LENGTH=208 /DNA_ID=CAMNT_0043444991 /DNA_START=52 /DNA_END=678 /DNA_ORIENTATION=+
MNYGQRGRELLVDLKKSSDSDTLALYNEEGVRSTLQECTLHYKEMQGQASLASSSGTNSSSGGNGEVPMTSRASLLLHDAAIRRNKRCLLAYHAHRVNGLRHMSKFDHGSTLSMLPMLSEHEQELATQYEQLYTGFSPAILNLLEHVHPPEEEWVEVRVLEDIPDQMDCGGILVNLDYNTTHYLPRSGTVEQLIRRAMLQQLDSEENS